jgi:hypothetical protein
MPLKTIIVDTEMNTVNLIDLFSPRLQLKKVLRGDQTLTKLEHIERDLMESFEEQEILHTDKDLEMLSKKVFENYHHMIKQSVKLYILEKKEHEHVFSPAP